LNKQTQNVHPRNCGRVKRKKAIGLAIELFDDMNSIRIISYKWYNYLLMSDYNSLTTPKQQRNKLHAHHTPHDLYPSVTKCHVFLNPTLHREVLYHYGRRQRKYGNTRKQFFA